jgi:hypothetical protein
MAAAFKQMEQICIECHRRFEVKFAVKSSGGKK